MEGAHLETPLYLPTWDSKFLVLLPVLNIAKRNFPLLFFWCANTIDFGCEFNVLIL